MSVKTPISRSGYQRLVDELAHLRHSVRPEIIEELREARAYGAGAENRQYLQARERHAVLLRRIRILEEKLLECEVVVGRKFYRPQVAFGTVVVIQNVESGETGKYRLVGPDESDVGNGEISVESPVGEGLLGRFEGEEVVVLTPSGMRIFLVLSIEL